MIRIDASAPKPELRSALIRARRATPAQARRVWDAAIHAHLSALAEFKSARAVFSYAGHGWEIATLPLLYELMSRGAAVGIPLCLPGGIMEPRLLTRHENALIPGAFGLPGPNPEVCPPFCAEDIDLIITPALAFDREGYRIGRGGGYYDRFLTIGAPSVGLCYEAFLFDRLRREEHDRAVDQIVTENGAVIRRLNII